MLDVVELSQQVRLTFEEVGPAPSDILAVNTVSAILQFLGALLNIERNLVTLSFSLDMRTI